MLPIHEWLTRVSADNLNEKDPKSPFSTDLDRHRTYATDRFMVVLVSAPSTFRYPALVQEPDGTGPLPFYAKVVHMILFALEKAQPVGVLDVQMLQEYIGEPRWGIDHVKGIYTSPENLVRIKGYHYTSAVLARALAAWQEQTAQVYAASVWTAEGIPTTALLLKSKDIQVLCAPALVTEAREDIFDLPDGVLVQR